MQDKTILRAGDVVAILNIARPTFYNWIRRGIFPAGIQYGPNTVGWPRHVVDTWLAEKEATHPAIQNQ